MDFRGSNGFTFQEALDILFEADDEYQARVQEIYIEPLEVNILTDEDGAGAMDDLIGRQLLAPVEIQLENNDRIGAFNTLGDPPPPTKVIDQSPSVSIDVDKFIIQNEKWVRKRQIPIPEWITGDFDDRVQIFTWLIDVSVNNAWVLQRKVNPNMPQLQFRREIVRNLLFKYGTKPKVGGRPSTSMSSVSCNRISDDIRYAGKNHLIIPTPEKKRKRCAGEGCSASIRTMCENCNVGLCIECFKIFHSVTY